MLAEDSFREESTLIILFKFTQKNFMVLSKLNLVVLDGFSKVFCCSITIFKRMEMLKTVDGDGENLSCTLKNSLVFIL